MNLSQKLVDALLSRLFHDLISPVSAAVNGVELIEEFGAESLGSEGVGADALQLVGSSARQASARLSFFRVAYGGGGSTDDHTLEAARELARAYLDTRKTGFRFEEGRDLSTLRPRAGGVKVLLAAVSLAADCLPRGGDVLVELAQDSGVKVIASGAGARLEEAAREALSAPSEQPLVDTRSVVAAALAASCGRFGIPVKLSTDRDSVCFEFGLPMP